MSELKPGTPCFLTSLSEHWELTGRVVEVVAGPLPDEAVETYRVNAEWTRQMFPGCDIILALRSQLMPIIPPGIASPAARTRTPETVR